MHSDHANRHQQPVCEDPLGSGQVIELPCNDDPRGRGHGRQLSAEQRETEDVLAQRQGAQRSTEVPTVVSTTYSGLPLTWPKTLPT